MLLFGDPANACTGFGAMRENPSGSAGRRGALPAEAAGSWHPEKRSLRSAPLHPAPAERR